MLASLMVVLLFLTATTYTQVAMGVVLYPAVAFVALHIFPRRTRKSQIVSVSLSSSGLKANTIVSPYKSSNEAEEVLDTDKRAFFKLIGTAGLSLFVLSLFSKRAEIPFFGRLVGGAALTAVTDTSGSKIDPSERQPLDGYQIAEFDDNVVSYYGLSNKHGAWVIMRENTDSNSFRYAKGDINFSENWSKRTSLKYNYFHNVF